MKKGVQIVDIYIYFDYNYLVPIKKVCIGTRRKVTEKSVFKAHGTDNLR